MSHRFEGHNLEDALNNAATTLGVYNKAKRG